jgi:hypothetical protein
LVGMIWLLNVLWFWIAGMRAAEGIEQ